MLLTEQEIEQCFNEADGTWRSAYKRIEAKLLEKLKAQEPVAHVVEHEGGTTDYVSATLKDCFLRMNKGWAVVSNLYEHPLPPDDVVRDAERYRWLRNHDTGFCEFSIFVDEDGISQRGSRFNQIPEMLDAAIDAAMEKMK